MKAVEDLINSKFVYEADEKLDSWHILDLSKDKVYGDCDDYSFTVAYYMANKSLFKVFLGSLTGKYIFWLCKTKRGELHLALYHNFMYIDNIDNKWAYSCNHKKIFPMWFPIPLMKWLIGKIKNQKRG